MATINLGRVKPVFRGAYAGGTAYVVDDIVTYSNETYICILASTGNLPTDTTYWTKLAAKGTDGTDVSTTLTTQGDLLYRDGSGLQRLGAGTAGQALITQGTGANPIWGSAGGIKQVIQGTSSTIFSQSSPNDSTYYFPSSNKISATITPSSTSSRILVNYISTTKVDSTGGDMGVSLALKEIISGGSTTTYHPSSSSGTIKIYSSGLYFATTVSSNFRPRLNEFILLSPNTTSAITYEVGVGGYAATNVILNDDSSTGRILLMEVTV
jgi:hypothetical protein